MEPVGAIVFLPREGSGASPMLEDLLFAPAAVWLAEALKAAGVERFFVVCQDGDRARAEACFPQGSQFVTDGTADAMERLLAFLDEREGKAAVFTRPVLLSAAAARQLVTGSALPAGRAETGACRISAAALAGALRAGRGFEEALTAEADKQCGDCVWFQGAAILRRDSDHRMEAEARAKDISVRRLMDAGVRIMDPNTVYVDPTVRVGAGTVLLPGTILRGATAIGQNCEIGPNSMIRDCTVGDGVTVNASQLNESTVDAGAKIGPFAYIRPHCHVGRDVKVGDFVELKNSTIGDGTKISHLTYVGDADVGGHVNFGCGTVTVNYDGASKFRTAIGDHAFIGCNTNLVAPVTVGEGAYTAAGSTITDDVPADSLAIARAQQVVKKQWAAKRRARRSK